MKFLVVKRQSCYNPFNDISYKYIGVLFQKGSLI